MKKINFGEQSLTDIPESLWQDANADADELYLHNNQLSSLPEMIGSLRNLRVLDLGHNKLVNCASRAR